MGYISFIKDYYINKINEYENTSVSLSKLKEAKELLKLMDDLVSEGYKDAYNIIENEYHGITRLKDYIIKNNESPFEIVQTYYSNSKYNGEDILFDDFINNIIDNQNKYQDKIVNSFAYDLKRFYNYIIENETNNTSYVFLMRDTMLLYLGFLEQKINNIYPLFLSRKSLEILKSTKDDLHTIFTNIIFEGLSRHPQNFSSLIEEIRDKIIMVVNDNPLLKEYLESFLKQIKGNRIIIIESGYNGTFPLVLACLDNRVSFKMFTTAPYLYELYTDKFFTVDYHKNRMFETLVSQDLMFNISKINKLKTYINFNIDQEVIDQGYNEIYSWLNYLFNK